MQFYFKRDEVVFEHGGGNQVLAQDPKPKCPELDLLFPELDLGQADTSLNLLLCLQKQTYFGLSLATCFGFYQWQRVKMRL